MSLTSHLFFSQIVFYHSNLAMTKYRLYMISMCNVLQDRRIRQKITLIQACYNPTLHRYMWIQD
jgi:hypothetical protein